MTGWRRGCDRAYAYVASLFMIGVLVQFFLAGLGVFGVDGKVKDASGLDPHRALGSILGGVALIMLILALLARESGRTMLWTFVLALLTAVGQPALAGAGEDHHWVGGLHAFDGVLILGLGGWLTAMAHRREAARRREGAVTPAAA
jgi:heme/copper-type cytochrome/quinol oxidase subunit 1